MKSARRASNQIDDRIVSVFEGFPLLCGFTVQDCPGLPDGGSERLPSGLFLTDVGFYPQPGLEDARMICESLRDTLIEIIEERPEAQRQLAGRTFARSLQ